MQITLRNIVGLAAVVAAVIWPFDSSQAESAGASADSLTLAGDRDGTVLPSLTVEAENQVQIEFERPELVLDIDPAETPGLEWDRALEVLEREGLDLTTPLLAQSAFARTPYLARPWLDQFKSGAVARFHPDVEGVDRWQLTVANSRGETVATFAGKGKPPAEIPWDGRSLDGTPVPPGFTYSHVFEAFDRAGNKRNFVGEGFEISPYRIETEGQVLLLFAGDGVRHGKAAARRQSGLPPPLLLEAANWLNQIGNGGQPIRLTATARTFGQAQALAERVRTALAPFVLGDPLRLQTITDVQPDAPSQGTIMIAADR
jgi:hypothetical protein